MNTREIIEHAVADIVAQFHPERVILFGSQARGDATPDSDVDFLVVMPDGTNRRHVAVQILTALSDMQLPKDVIVTTPQEIATRGQLPSTVLYTALHEGTVLYVQ